MTYAATINLANLAAVRSRIERVIKEEPDVAICLTRALEEIDVAADILTGELELTACEDCGCTIEDGECEC